MLANIRAQPLGAATVDDLALSEPFLRRFADRVVRSSFEANVRIVVRDGEVATTPHAGADAVPSATSAELPAAAPSSSAWLYAVGAVGVLLIAWLALRRRSPT